MSQVQTDKNNRDHRAFDTRFCHRCRGEREFSKRTVPHLWHLGLTIITFGLWGVAWAAVTYNLSRRPWRCSICGSRHVSEPLPDSAESAFKAVLPKTQITPRKSAIASYRNDS